MREVRFTYRGTVKPKERPRFGRYGVYTPNRTRSSESNIALEALVAMKDQSIMDGYICAFFHFTVAIPQSFSKKKRNDALEGKIFPQKGDLDNLVKCVCDSCNKMVYRDDRQIIYIEAMRSYGKDDMAVIRFVEVHDATEVEAVR